MIIVWPFNGLCNRMRMIASAIELGQRTQKKVILIWLKSDECSAEFRELFADNPLLHRVIELDTSFVARLKFKALRLALKLARFKFFDQTKTESHLSDQAYWVNQASSKHLFIHSHSDFFDDKSSLTSFIPHPLLVAEIEKHPNHSRIGIHIRGQDNVRAKEMRGAAMFEGIITQITQDDPNQEFFLATDEPITEKSLIEQFPGKVFLYNKKSRSRSDSQGIKDAVVDLYALSRCKNLIGSYWSSFSEIAARLGNIELLIAGQHDSSTNSKNSM